MDVLVVVDPGEDEVPEISGADGSFALHDVVPGALSVGAYTLEQELIGADLVVGAVLPPVVDGWFGGARAMHSRQVKANVVWMPFHFPEVRTNRLTTDAGDQVTGTGRDLKSSRATTDKARWLSGGGSWTTPVIR